MSEWVYRDCPTCVHVDELEPEDSTNPVDWYGTLHEPIVRCRDCLHVSYDGVLSTGWCNENCREVRPDCFCAWGEVRAGSSEVRAGTCSETMIDNHFRGCSECGYTWEHMYAVGNRTKPNYCPNCGRKVEG